MRTRTCADGDGTAREWYRYRANGAPAEGDLVDDGEPVGGRAPAPWARWRGALSLRWVTPLQRCYHGTLGLTVTVAGRRVDRGALRRVLRMPPQPVRQDAVAGASTNASTKLTVATSTIEPPGLHPGGS